LKPAFAVISSGESRPLIHANQLCNGLSSSFENITAESIKKLFATCRAHPSLTGCIWIHTAGKSTDTTIQFIKNFLNIDKTMTAVLVSSDSSVQARLQSALVSYNCITVNSFPPLELTKQILGSAVTKRNAIIADLNLHIHSHIAAYSQGIMLALQARDMVTAIHSLHTAEICAMLLKEFISRFGHYKIRAGERTIKSCFKLPSDIHLVRYAGRIHDCGKLFMDFSVLSKRSKLTTAEFKIMQPHVNFSNELIARCMLPGFFDHKTGDNEPEHNEDSFWKNFPFPKNSVKACQFYKNAFFWIYAISAHHYIKNYPETIKSEKIKKSCSRCLIPRHALCLPTISRVLRRAHIATL